MEHELSLLAGPQAELLCVSVVVVVHVFFSGLLAGPQAELWKMIFAQVCRGASVCMFLVSWIAGGAAGGALENFFVRICLLRMCAKDVC